MNSALFRTPRVEGLHRRRFPRGQVHHRRKGGGGEASRNTAECDKQSLAQHHLLPDLRRTRTSARRTPISVAGCGEGVVVYVVHLNGRKGTLERTMVR